MSIPQTFCPACGTPHDDTRTQPDYLSGVLPPACPLCTDGWDMWELRFAPIPLEKNRAQIASWLGQLPFPSAIDLACTEKGIRVRMFTPPGSADGAIRSWAAMTHQQTRWVKLPASEIPQSQTRFVLKNTTHVPSVSLTDRGGDPIQTAYLKAHYPVEYMAALLNSFLNNTDQVVKYINECREKNLELLPPDVNASDKDFIVVGGKIRFGLGAVRNVGEAAIEVIIRSREEQGPFQSFYDFGERVDSQKVNRRVLEQLIKCGAFDTLHPRRAQVFAALYAALERAQAAQRDRQSGQVNMYANLRARKKQVPDHQLADVPDWDGRQTLLFEKESHEAERIDRYGPTLPMKRY